MAMAQLTYDILQLALFATLVWFYLRHPVGPKIFLLTYAKFIPFALAVIVLTDLAIAGILL